MADIDAELLALAGDASSDEEDAPMNISRESSVASDEERQEAPAKASNGRKAGGKKSRARRGQNDSEEEGEASSDPPTPNSSQSAPMDESDASDGQGTYDDGDRYPLEGKFKNATDKAEILAMPEIKREELLAERAQEVELDRQNRALRQLLKQRDAQSEKQDKKRKAGDAKLDESQRKTSRQRTKIGGGRVGEASSGIDHLKRARAEKDERQRRRQEDRARNPDRRGYGQDDYSDGEGGHSDVEWADPEKRPESPSHGRYIEDTTPATLADFNRIKISRENFAKVCFYPGFDEAISGCFVRIYVGEATDGSGTRLYRMSQIKGFAEGKPYPMQASNGKTFATNQYALCTLGKHEKAWPFIVCSGDPITESEFNRYKTYCHNDNISLPTKMRCEQKLQDINALINRTWTEAELQEKLTRQGMLKAKFKNLDRGRLQNAIKEAEASGDEAQLAALQKQLAELEGPQLAFKTSMAPAKKGPPKVDQQERLAKLNAENRRKNAEEVRQALLNERRKNRAIEAAVARGENVAVDESRRVKTKAKFRHDVNEIIAKKEGGEVDSGASTPAQAGTPAQTGTPKVAPKTNGATLPVIPSTQPRIIKGVKAFSKPPNDDDIIGAMDIGISDDLDLL